MLTDVYQQKARLGLCTHAGNPLHIYRRHVLVTVKAPHRDKGNGKPEKNLQSSLAHFEFLVMQ